MKERIREILAGVGVSATDEALDNVLANYDMMMEQLNALSDIDLPPLSLPLSDDTAMAGAVLISLGLGNIDYGTGEWTPFSGDVYAFDTEVFDISVVYTQFLRGVETIVPGISFTDIVEDISGLSNEPVPSDNPLCPDTDGTRRLEFSCNGTRYSTELESFGDWFNMAAIEFMNSVLEKEGFEHRLHVAGGDGQAVLLIYGTGERAEKIMRLFMPVFE